MTIHINPHLFLPYLVSQIKKQGGRFVERFFTSEEEFDNLPEEIIINCTGLGARELSKDVYMKPLKGQLVICEYSENKLRKYLYHLDSISGDGKYIYPHPEEKKANGKIEIALGGTAEETDNIRPEAKVTEEILKGNMKILPNLKEKSSIAGLRPYRTIGPRIGKRKVGTKTIIDNYGHGGSGYTLCWGSAKKALSYIR